MKREVIKFLYLERIGLGISFTFIQRLLRKEDRCSFLCASVHFVGKKHHHHPNSFGTTQLESEIMKTFYQEGNISFWQAHLCATPSTEVLEKKIFGHISYTGFLVSWSSPPKDGVKWGPSPLQEKIALFRVTRDHRDHVVEPLRIIDKEKLRLSAFSKVMQLLNTSPLICLTNSSRTFSCHHCYPFTWLSILLYPAIYPFHLFKWSSYIY